VVVESLLIVSLLTEADALVAGHGALNKVLPRSP
jgi:hypothetical protein